MDNDITASLIDLRDSMYRCMEVYYAEDLPKMVTYSMDYHKKVISFLRLMRGHRQPLTDGQQKLLLNVKEIMTIAYNREPMYKYTNIGNHEDHGFTMLEDDIVALSSSVPTYQQNSAVYVP